MKRAVILFVLGLGALYLMREAAPPGWFDLAGPSASAPGALDSLQRSVGGALERGAGRF